MNTHNVDRIPANSPEALAFHLDLGSPRRIGRYDVVSCSCARSSDGPTLARRLCVKRVEGPDAGEWVMVHPGDVLYVFLPKAVRPGTRAGQPRVLASWAKELEVGVDAVHVRTQDGIFRTVHHTLSSFLRIFPIDLLYANQSVAVNVHQIAGFERSNPRKPLLRFDVDPDRWRWNLEYVGVSRRNVPFLLEVFGLKPCRPLPANADAGNDEAISVDGGDCDSGSSDAAP